MLLFLSFYCHRRSRLQTAISVHGSSMMYVGLRDVRGSVLKSITCIPHQLEGKPHGGQQPCLFVHYHPHTCHSIHGSERKGSLVPRSFFLPLYAFNVPRSRPPSSRPPGTPWLARETETNVYRTCRRWASVGMTVL